MIRLWHWWARGFSAEEVGTSMALFRIAVGLVLTLDALSIGLAGVIDPLYLPNAEGGMAPANRFPSLLLAVVGHTTTTTWGLWAAMLALSVLCLAGLGGRLTHFALLQVVLAWHAIPIDIGGGYDRLITNALFLLVVGNTTATLSVDCRLRTGAWTSDTPVLALARYLAVIQLSLLYTATGYAKTGSGWHWPYEAVFRSLQIETWTRWSQLPWLGAAYPLTQVGTVVALWWERTFWVVLVWFAAHLGWLGPRARGWAVRVDLRWPYLGIGLAMHAILGATMNLGTFTAITLCFYLPFLAPEEAARLLARPRAR